MGIADAIGVTGPAPDADMDQDKPEEMKPGDHGKRILAAIKSNNAVALETAIKDCAQDTTY